jgi:hypothetical protein
MAAAQNVTLQILLYALDKREFCFADQDATKPDEADIAVKFYCSNRIVLKPITVHLKIMSYIGSPASHTYINSHAECFTPSL